LRATVGILLLFCAAPSLAQTPSLRFSVTARQTKYRSAQFCDLRLDLVGTVTNVGPTSVDLLKSGANARIVRLVFADWKVIPEQRHEGEVGGGRGEPVKLAPGKSMSFKISSGTHVEQDSGKSWIVDHPVPAAGKYKLTFAYALSDDVKAPIFVAAEPVEIELY
jgi:hypothetical protein